MLNHRRKLIDGLLLLLLVSCAFAMGCQELYDADIWWHLKSGQWVWAQGKFPSFDPFTFTSADRPWIDMHWLFQLSLAAAFAAGGIRGMILLASAVCAAVLYVGLSARESHWPFWLVAACWLAAFVAISQRVAPRPELFSLLWIAVYLAVLLRADQTPKVVWVLPAVQVLWVNMHGLFVLGPLILGAYWTDLLAGLIWRNGSDSASIHVSTPRQASFDQGRWWWHVVGATVAVGVACMVNPYGLRGVLFPLEILPKITSWGGVYKSYIMEYRDLREQIHLLGLSSAAGNPYYRCELFLMWMLPLSFIVPAMWHAGRPVASGSGRGEAAVWLIGFGLAAFLIVAAVLGLPAHGVPGWMAQRAWLVPLGLVVLAVTGAVPLVLRSRQGALLAIGGGVAEAAWVFWLRAYLFVPEPASVPSMPARLAAWPGGGAGLPAFGWGAAALGGVSAVLILRVGEHRQVFRLLLAVAFTYLAIQAIRNINLFGLAAGYVLTCNLGEWFAAMQPAALGEEKGRRRFTGSEAGLAIRVALCCFTGLFLFTIVSNRFFLATGETRQFGAFASPLAYAHDAARFAGQPGLPERALAFSLRQAGVYMFHNGPRRKLFVDGQNEVHSRETFETYARLDLLLNQGREGWAEIIRRMGEPLILLEHQKSFGAEATLLLDPGWRCIYYDAVGSVFVSARLRELEASFPSIDFAARTLVTLTRNGTTCLLYRGGWGRRRRVYNLRSVILLRPGPSWPLRFSLMLLACDRLRQGMAARQEAADASLWTLMGNCYRGMLPDVADTPPGPGEPWDRTSGLLLAQSAYCYRRALGLNPKEPGALASLAFIFRGRGMNDALRSLAISLDRERGTVDPTDQASPLYRPELLPAVNLAGRGDLTGTIADLLHRGRAEEAVRTFELAQEKGLEPPWAVRDQIAVTLLHLGRPAEARWIWDQAADAPSAALRLVRIAAAHQAALDYTAAARLYLSALEVDPRSVDARFGLTLLHVQLGETKEALAAIRDCQRLPLSPSELAFLRVVETLAAPRGPPTR